MRLETRVRGSKIKNRGNVPDKGFRANCDHASNSDPHVRQSSEAVTPASQFREDDRIRDEAEIHDAVNKRDVDVPEDTGECELHYASHGFGNLPDGLFHSHCTGSH